MKQINVTLEVRDDFEPGDCYHCPLHYVEYYYDEDDGSEGVSCCALGKGYFECPLEVK